MAMCYKDNGGEAGSTAKTEGAAHASTSLSPSQQTLQQHHNAPTPSAALRVKRMCDVRLALQTAVLPHCRPLQPA